MLSASRKEVLGTEKPLNRTHQLFSSYIMSESMDSMFSCEDIIVETVSSTKVIQKGNIAPIASSKQTEDITMKTDRKQRNADISDIIYLVRRERNMTFSSYNNTVKRKLTRRSSS